MQSNSDQNFIEELKAAGEELKKASEGGFSYQEPSTVASEKLGSKTKPSAQTPADKITAQVRADDFLKKIEDYQKELNGELAILEKKHQEVQELEKKLIEKIEVIKGLKIKSAVFNKEIKEFQEQLKLAKKEDSNLLDQIKNKLGKENDPSN